MSAGDTLPCDVGYAVLDGRGKKIYLFSFGRFIALLSYLWRWQSQC
jgi:hypothetical protein